MTTHQELLDALPPRLDCARVARLLRVEVDDVISCLAEHGLPLDDRLHVSTPRLLVEFGLLARNEDGASA